MEPEANELLNDSDPFKQNILKQIYSTTKNITTNGPDLKYTDFLRYISSVANTDPASLSRDFFYFHHSRALSQQSTFENFFLDFINYMVSKPQSRPKRKYNKRVNNYSAQSNYIKVPKKPPTSEACVPVSDESDDDKSGEEKELEDKTGEQTKGKTTYSDQETETADNAGSDNDDISPNSPSEPKKTVCYDPRASATMPLPPIPKKIAHHYKGLTHLSNEATVESSALQPLISAAQIQFIGEAAQSTRRNAQKQNDNDVRKLHSIIFLIELLFSYRHLHHRALFQIQYCLKASKWQKFMYAILSSSILK
jgi:hypothetical protein